MTICKQCKNILTKQTGSSGLKFICGSCGEEYKSTASDTRMSHESSVVKLFRPKSGTAIYHYASNPKSYTPCPECKSPITAWERTNEFRKIHGCQCGYSWIDTIEEKKSEEKSEAKSEERKT
jgi:DNA-directed RNA polymerase subunit M/transcription elongation factor TFIIS